MTSGDNRHFWERFPNRWERALLRGIGWIFIGIGGFFLLLLAVTIAAQLLYFVSNSLGLERNEWLVLLAVGIFILLVSCILTLPTALVRRDADLNGGRLTQAEYLKAKNDVRTTLLQAIAGGLLLLGAFFTWRQLQETSAQVDVAQEQLGLTQEQLDDTRSDRIGERFNRAVDQLGSSALDVRLGGIFSLERIGEVSDDDSWRITEVLTAFVQHHTHTDALNGPSQDAYLPDLRRRAPDVQAALLSHSQVS
jgi:hypothetical protein